MNIITYIIGLEQVRHADNLEAFCHSFARVLVMDFLFVFHVGKARRVRFAHHKFYLLSSLEVDGVAAAFL